MQHAKKFVTLLAAVVAVGLTACGQEKKPEASKPQAAAESTPTIDIKIGHVAPLTGSIAHLGKDNENGARLAIEQANAAKIMIGGKLAHFELIAEDDQADPKVGTTVAQWGLLILVLLLLNRAWAARVGAKEDR